MTHPFPSITPVPEGFSRLPVRLIYARPIVIGLAICLARSATPERIIGRLDGHRPRTILDAKFDVEETVERALETIAPHYGLEKSDAPLLRLQFSKTILTPKQQLTTEGMCGESICHELGTEAALENIREANTLKVKSMDIIEAARDKRVADVQLV